MKAYRRAPDEELSPFHTSSSSTHITIQNCKGGWELLCLSEYMFCIQLTFLTLFLLFLLFIVLYKQLGSPFTACNAFLSWFKFNTLRIKSCHFSSTVCLYIVLYHPLFLPPILVCYYNITIILFDKYPKYIQLLKLFLLSSFLL